MDIDPEILVNLIFCIITLALGITAYSKMKKLWPLFIGIAFAFFGVSHLFTIIGIDDSQEIVMLVTRIIGYALTIFAIYWYGCRKYAR
ncbi:MAG: hypothetical protein E3J92_03905 [Dehalococcoidia bacterium]|nr:MAG: hypothetical protein E3J92_03905 [Dehalococcoidia bacterium]